VRALATSGEVRKALEGHTKSRHGQQPSRSEWRRASLTILVASGLWLMAATACGGANAAQSCGLTAPWLEVVNQLPAPVDAAWDGGKTISVPPTSSRFIDPTGVNAHPPYHLVVRDHQTGSLVAQLTINVLSGPEAMTLSQQGGSTGPTTCSALPTS